MMALSKRQRAFGARFCAVERPRKASEERSSPSRSDNLGPLSWILNGWASASYDL